MSAEPKKMLIRRADVMAWAGITRHEVSKLVAQGIIKPRIFSPSGHAYFHREEIRAKLIDFKNGQHD